MLAVSNSSPLIALSSIERLNLLQALFESVLIPPAVAHEISRSIPIAPAWLRMQTLKAVLPTMVLRRTLADGEREAIALAVELHADRIILDDLPARKIAQAIGLNAVGTLGVLLGAKQVGLLSQIRPELDKLVKHSFFLSPQLYQELLRAADEASS